MRPFAALLRTLTWACLASTALPHVVDAQAVGATKAPGDSTLPAYRFRLLGVFDDATGKPIEGVQVVDVLSGTSTMTPQSGTVSLFFLPDGGSLVHLRKLGYEGQTFMVRIAPADTTPLTISMVHATVLPPVVSTAPTNGVPSDDADVVERLEHVGFYDRERSSIAPSFSFVTAATLAHWNIHSLDELKAITGRSPCTGNLYINGAKAAVPSRLNIDGPGTVSLRFQSPLDDMVDIGSIAGIETYTGLEVPPEYGWGSCATLIWTR